MKKPFLEISVRRNQEDLVFKLKATEVIESYFKNRANGKTFTSSVWSKRNEDGTSEPAVFYALADNDEGIREFCADNQLSDNVGHSLTNGMKINIAFMRAVGISEGIRLQCKQGNMTNNFELEQFVKVFAEKVKEYYQQFIAVKEIKAVVGYEV